jgi:uroporphyrinogen decarboxylase
VDALDPSRLADAIAPILETVRLVRTGVGEATLIGFAGSPFTVACYMVEGQGTKEFAHVRRMAYSQPGLFAQLMDIVTNATIEYLSAQIGAGAEVVMLFDSWAGVLSPRLFQRHVIAPTKRIVDALAQRHPDTKVIGFPRGAGTLLGAYAADTGASAVAIDTGVDPAFAISAVPGDTALQGNLDPMALVAGGEALARETSGILDAMRGRPFIFNLGHGIVPETPPDHVAMLMQQIRSH